MTKRKPADRRFMELCHTALTWGTCPRARVGAVLAKNNRQLGPVGYNGAPSGQPHCDDVGCLIEDGHCIRALHAEYNALKFVGFDRAAGATLYTTHVPCYRCASKIVDAGIVRVVYESDYGMDVRARKLLMSACELYEFVDGAARLVKVIETVGVADKAAILARSQSGLLSGPGDGARL